MHLPPPFFKRLQWSRRLGWSQLTSGHPVLGTFFTTSFCISKDVEGVRKFLIGVNIFHPRPLLESSIEKASISEDCCWYWLFIIAGIVVVCGGFGSALFGKKIFFHHSYFSPPPLIWNPYQDFDLHCLFWILPLPRSRVLSITHLHSVRVRAIYEWLWSFTRA